MTKFREITNRRFLLRDERGWSWLAHPRFTQLELLQGSKNESEWRKLHRYLSTQYYLEASQETWIEAARIYFELRRIGRTIYSPIDCCIAQIAIENDVVLLHRDHDFSTIATIRPFPVVYLTADEPI